MSEVTTIVFIIAGIYIAERLLRIFLKERKIQRVIKHDMQDLLHNPKYKVRGKYE